MKNKGLQYIVVFSFLFLLFACENKPKDLIPRRAMTDFLFELHKLDGSLMADGKGYTDNADNALYYNALLNKYGYSKAQFDSSVVWYTAHPKVYEKMYVEILDRLNKMIEDVKANVYHPIDSVALRNSHSDMWYLQRAYNFAPDSSLNIIDFKIIDSQLRWNDRYELKLRQRLWADNDSTPLNKRIVLRIHYAEGITDSICTISRADSLFYCYTLNLRARIQLPIEKITGELISDTCQKSNYFALIDSIQFVRYYDALAQDSIKTLIEQEVVRRDSIKNAAKVLEKDSLHTDTTKADTAKAVVVKSTETKKQIIKTGKEQEPPSELKKMKQINPRIEKEFKKPHE